jgi:NhaA family Na+:H+ antiporter
MAEKITRIYRTLKNPPIIKVASPLQRFIQKEASSSKIMLVCIALGLIWANIPYGDTYNVLFSLSISIEIGSISVSQPLIWWINDALMTIFFVLIGLELKREIVIGGLRDKKDALYAVITGFMGMIFPLSFFMFLNYPSMAGFRGWSVPMSTDIAIALGILSFFSYEMPKKIRLMLTSIAIIDDVGSIIIIAIFYSHSINWLFFGLIFVIIALLIFFNLIGIRNLFFYIVPGLILWFFMFSSGIHPTIAGVIFAATVPATKRIDLCDFYDIGKKYLNDISELELDPDEVSCYNRVITQAYALEQGFKNIRTPLDILEHKLIGWVAFLIVPVFTIANAGVNLFGLTTNPFSSRVFWGIILGLVFGKSIAVLSTTFILHKTGLFDIPNNVNWLHILGLSFLLGIGFTMSNFLAGLAFIDNVELLAISKLGILFGSIISGVTGYFILRQAIKKSKQKAES